MAFGRLKIFATHFASSDGSNKKPFLAAPNPQMEKQRQQDLIRALFAKYRKWEIDLRRCSKYKVLNIHQSRKYKKHVHVVLLGIEKAKVNCLFEVQSLQKQYPLIFLCFCDESIYKWEQIHRSITKCDKYRAATGKFKLNPFPKNRVSVNKNKFSEKNAQKFTKTQFFPLDRFPFFKWLISFKKTQPPNPSP